jgi:hypothetical protein
MKVTAGARKPREKSRQTDLCSQSFCAAVQHEGVCPYPELCGFLSPTIHDYGLVFVPRRLRYIRVARNKEIPDMCMFRTQVL